MPPALPGVVPLLLQLSLSSPEAATEWALLAEPLEPHLAAAGVMAGMGPRIAVVTALCQLAAAAGLVPSSPAGSMLAPGSQGPGGGEDFVEAAVAAGVELWREWMQVRGGMRRVEVRMGEQLLSPACMQH